MSFHAWRDVLRDLEPNPSLPAGMSRQGIVGERAMLCMHEAFPNLTCAPHSIESLEDYVQVLDVLTPLRPDILARLREIEAP